MKRRFIALLAALSVFCTMITVSAAPAAEADSVAESVKTDKLEKETSVLESFGISVLSNEEGRVTNEDFSYTLLQILGLPYVKTFEEASAILKSTGVVPSDMRFLAKTVMMQSEAYLFCLNALGYGACVSSGTQGVLASRIHLDKGIRPQNELDKDAATKLVYNTLMAKCNDIVCVKGEYADYKEGSTPLEKYHGGIYVKGVVRATEEAALFGYEDFMQKGRAYIEGRSFLTGDTGLEDYLGCRVELFGIDDGGDGEYRAAVFFPTDTDSELMIPLDKMEYVRGFNSADNAADKTNPKICYLDENDRSVTETLSANVTVLYNGNASAAVSNESFVGENGSLRLIDADRDGVYDVAYLRSYISGRVVTADAQSMCIAMEGGTIYDLKGADSVKITEKAHSVPFSNIGDGTVIGLYAAPDKIEGTRVEIEIFTDIVSGQIKAIDPENREIETDDRRFSYSKHITNLKLGMNCRLVLDNNGMVVYAFINDSGASYAYFIGYGVGRGIAKSVTLRVLEFNNKRCDYALGERIAYTGPDENGEWLENVSMKEERIKNILAAHFTEHCLIQIEKNDKDVITKIVLPRSMVGAEDYKGYDESAFTLESVVASSNASFLRTGRVLDKTYLASASQTMVILDNLSDEEDIEISAYTLGNSNILTEYSYCMDNAYLYDADSKLVCSVVVLRYNPESSALITGSNLLLEGGKMIVEKVSKAIKEDGEETYTVSGYMANKQKMRYTAENALVSQKFNTVWSSRGSRTVAELKTGDIIIPILNSSGELKNFYLLLGLDENGRAPEHYHSYANTTTAQHTYLNNTVCGRIKKNYENNIVRFEHVPDALFRVEGIVYICDSARGRIIPSGAGEYLMDASSGEQDTVCMIRNQQTTQYIVIYR